MQKNPASVKQLVKDYPAYIGHTDACALGAGAIWTSGLDGLKPLVWQFEWAEDIKAKIHSPTNREGDLYINDLELIGL
eukprot:2941207-Ditylum_brightwellii.AAC.1